MKDNLEDAKDEHKDEKGHSAIEENKLNENQDMLVCPICLSHFNEQQIGLPNSCQHAFCLGCILEWSKNAHSCPVDRIAFQSIQAYQCNGGRFLFELPMQENVLKNEEKVENFCKFCSVGYSSRSHCSCLKFKLNDDSLKKGFRKNHCIRRSNNSCCAKTPVLSRTETTNLDPHFLPAVADELDENCARDIESAGNPSYMAAQKRRLLSQSIIRCHVPLPSLLLCGSRFSRELSDSSTLPILDDDAPTMSNRDILLDHHDSVIVQSKVFKRFNGCRSSFFEDSQRSNINENTFSKKQKIPSVQSVAVSPPQNQRVSTTGKQQSVSRANSEQNQSSRHSSNNSSTSGQGPTGSFSGGNSEQHSDFVQQENFEKMKPKTGSRLDKKSVNTLSLKRQRILIRPVLNLPKSEEESVKPPDTKDTPIQPQIPEDDRAKDDDDDAYNPFEPIISDDENHVSAPEDCHPDEMSSLNVMPVIEEPPSPDPISDFDIDEMLDSQFEEAKETRKKGKTGKMMREIHVTKSSELDIGNDLDMFAEEELEKAQAAAKMPKTPLVKPTISHLLSSLDTSDVKLPKLDAEFPLAESIKSETVFPKSQSPLFDESVTSQLSFETSKPSEMAAEDQEPQLQNRLTNTQCATEESINQNNVKAESTELKIPFNSHREKLDTGLKHEPEGDGSSEEEVGLEIRPINENIRLKKSEKGSKKTNQKQKSHSKSPKRRSLRSRSRSRKTTQSSPKRSSYKSHSSSRKRDRSRSPYHRHQSSRTHRSRTPRRKNSSPPSRRSKKHDDDDGHRRRSRKSSSTDRHKSRKRSRSRSIKKTTEASRKWSSKSKSKRSRSPKDTVKKTEKHSNKSGEKRDNEEGICSMQKEERHKEVFYVEVPPYMKCSEEKHDIVDACNAEDTPSVQIPLADNISDSKQKSNKKKKKHKEVVESSPEFEDVYRKKKKHKKQFVKSSSEDETESTKYKSNKKRKKSDKFEEVSDSGSERKSKKHKKRENASPERHNADIILVKDELQPKSSKKHAKAKKSKDKEEFESDNHKSKKRKKRERIPSSSENDVSYREDIQKHKRSKKHKKRESPSSSEQQSSPFDHVFEVDVKKKKKKRRKEDFMQEHKGSYKCSDTKKKEVGKKKSYFEEEKYEKDVPVVGQKISKISSRENTSSADDATPQNLEINKSALSDLEREPDLTDNSRTLESPCIQMRDYADRLLPDNAQSHTKYHEIHELDFHASSKSPRDLGDTVSSAHTHVAITSDDDDDYSSGQQRTYSPSDVKMTSDDEGHISPSLPDEPNNDILSPPLPSSSLPEYQHKSSSPLHNQAEEINSYADKLLEQSIEEQENMLQHKSHNLVPSQTALEIPASEEQIDESSETHLEQKPQTLDIFTDSDTGNEIPPTTTDLSSEVSAPHPELLADQDLFSEAMNSSVTRKDAEQEKNEDPGSGETSAKDVADELHNSLKSSDKSVAELPASSEQNDLEGSVIHIQRPLVPQYEDFDYQQQSGTSDNNQDMNQNKLDTEAKNVDLSKSDDKVDSTRRFRPSRSPPKSTNDVVNKSSTRKSYKHRRSRSRDRKRKRYRRSSSRSPSRKRAYSPRRKRSRSRDRRRPYSDRRRSRSPNRRRRSPSKEGRYRHGRRSSYTSARSPKRSQSPKKETMSKFKPIPPAQPSFPTPIVAPAQDMPVQEIPDTFSPQPIATISGISTVSTVGRVQESTIHDYHQEISHHHDHDLPSNALTSLFNTTRPALIEIPTVDHPTAQIDATVAPSTSGGETNDVELPITPPAKEEATTEVKSASDLYSPSCPMSPLSPPVKVEDVALPPPPPPKTQESSIDVASNTAMSLFTKLLSLPKGATVQDEGTSKEDDGLKDKETMNVLNPTQILNIVGLKPQLDAKDAIMSIAELSKQLQLGQILSSDKKKEAAPEATAPSKEPDGLSPVNIDSIESSAVALYNRDKKKLEQQRKEFQDKVVAAAKLAIKPHYERREVSKSQYKDIMKRAVNKICQTDKNMDVNEVKIRRLIRRYVECYQQKNEKGKEKIKAGAEKGTKPKMDFSSELLDSPPSPDESPLTGPDSPFEETSCEVTPSLLKKKPRQIVTLPDLPLPPPPPPPRPKYMM